MLRSIGAILKNNSADLLSELGIGGGIILLPALVVAVVLILTGEPTAIDRIPAILWGVFAGLGCIVILIIGFVRMASEFPMLLLFPLTRRAAVAGECATIVLHSLTVEAVIALFCPLAYLACGQGSALPGVLAEVPWWVWPLPPLAAVLVALFGGGVIARFGRRGGWFLYFFFLVPCWFATPIMEWFEQLVLTPAQLRALGIVGIAALAALPLLGLRWLLRAPVR